MAQTSDTIPVKTRRVKCDGTSEGSSAALGHPRVWLEIDDSGVVECGYCDRRFELVGGGGPAAH